jgi:predicted TIM-barrel fold metal-dependent hydrolase
MTREIIISTDCHATAPREVFTEYLEPTWRDDHAAWAAAVADTAHSANPHPQIDERVNWDNDRRIAGLEAEGTVAEVVYPNGLPFGYHCLEIGPDPDPVERARQAASLRAYNRWLADFCAAAPGRRAGCALVLLDDIDEAVAEVRAAAANGLRGIMLPGPGGDPWYFEPRLDPFWQACCDHRTLVVQHAAGILPRRVPTGFAALMTIALENDFFAGRSMWQMMLGGVFDRFPTLRYVLAEGGASWVPQKLDEIDALIDRTSSWSEFAAHIGREATMQRSAWDYWRENCWVGASFMSPHDARRRREIGVDQMMFGLDYPHFESTFSRTKRWIQSTLGSTDTTEDELRRILSINAAEAFGFDLAELQPIADRVGFDTAELLTAPERPIRDYRVS